MGKERIGKWYVLDPNGKRISEVIAAGPYNSLEEAQAVWYDHAVEFHLLDFKRIETALAVEVQLQEALARYGGRYGRSTST